MTRPHPDHDVPALGIQQPWAELILRGIKTVELRSVDTNIRGRIYLYTSKRFSEIPPAREAIDRYELDVDALPRGLLVGSVEIVGTMKCDPAHAEAAAVPASYLDGHYAWELRNAERFDTPLPVRFLPYGMWFYPFQRRGSRPARSRR
jgi:hypothetical protein